MGVLVTRASAAGLARAASVIGVAAAMACAGGAVAAVGASAGVRSAAGLWDMSLNDTNRKCRMTLRLDPESSVYALAMPAGCRRAMPILASVNGWTAADDTLRLTDDSGNAVLQFTLSGDPANLVAKGPEGETYNLVAANPGPHLEAEPGHRATLVAQAAPGAQAATPAAEAAAPPPTPSLAEIPGRYDILRAGPKDTGCMLTLDAKAKGPKGGKRAYLAPACRDQGIVIFDPAGWRLEKNRLVLTAKKGHETHLDLQADGAWHKDPKEGAALILRKMGG